MRAGRRDMTRVAGANPRIWIDIFLDNAEELRASLAEHRRRVEELERALEARDAGWLARWVGEAGQPAPPARRGLRGPGRHAAGARTFGPAGVLSGSQALAPSRSTSRTSSSTTSRPSAGAR